MVPRSPPLLESFLSNGNLDDAASANILATLSLFYFKYIKEDYSQFDQGESPVTDAIRKQKLLIKVIYNFSFASIIF